MNHASDDLRILDDDRPSAPARYLASPSCGEPLPADAATAESPPETRSEFRSQSNHKAIPAVYERDLGQDHPHGLPPLQPFHHS